MKMKAFRLVDTDLCERFFGNPINVWKQNQFIINRAGGYRKAGK